MLLRRVVTATTPSLHTQSFTAGNRLAVRWKPEIDEEEDRQLWP